MYCYAVFRSTRQSPLGIAVLLWATVGAPPTAAADKIPALPDVNALWAAIKPVALSPKGEFETTKQFDTRRCTAAHQALGVAVDETVYIPRYHANYSEWYSADHKRFTFHNPGVALVESERYQDQWKWISTDPLNSKNSASQAAIGATLRKGPIYSGKSAYGVSTNVQVDNWEEFYLFMPEKAGIAHIEFPATPAEAQGLKGDLRVAFSGKLSAPCVVGGKKTSSPTLRKSVESNTILVGLVISDEQWIIYRQSTMEILKRSKGSVPKGNVKKPS